MEKFLSHIEKGDLAALRQDLVESGDAASVSARVNDLSRYGATPLGEAARHGQIPVLEFLIEKGANINGVDSQGWTPLMNAVSANKTQTAKILLGKQAKKDILNHAGQTVEDMLFAQKSPSPEMLALFSKSR